MRLRRAAAYDEEKRSAEVAAVIAAALTDAKTRSPGGPPLLSSLAWRLSDEERFELVLSLIGSEGPFHTYAQGPGDTVRAHVPQEQCSACRLRKTIYERWDHS